ncbi:hypothetical protein A3740_03210 [Oleiphilus sp. HI0068]|uniref:hypothetical protein n=1 Tax=Oleiphilus sp. HI0132 TaxID=1822270 RepID=UPI0007C34548|nr:hypothetical protein [Oleiphilus sp. HI0132]KZY73751.1 hypothetical protein A3740_03210 [Oleiphilus sp. HI0068]KZY84157.1 hypothetical protein A3741_16305 [Oleiphilus sp. HI0069]KZZ76737.1 hypothetical protein A3766_13175 [Oleiphilus sp. HI0132]
MRFCEQSQQTLFKWSAVLEAMAEAERSEELGKASEISSIASKGEDILSSYLVVIVNTFHQFVVGNPMIEPQIKEDIDLVLNEIKQNYEIEEQEFGIRLTAKNTLH